LLPARRLWGHFWGHLSETVLLVGAFMLTEVKIKQAKPEAKLYRLYDQGGLYLEVSPKGQKYWRYKFRINVGGARKEKRLAIGVYPEVSLKLARERHQVARNQVAEGQDPTQLRRLEKTQKALAIERSFGSISQDWFTTQSPSWSESHTTRQTRLLFKDLAALHASPIQQIMAPELLRVLRVIESRGALESARRANQVASQVFDHAIALGLCEHNPAGAVKRALKRPISKHHAAILEPDKLASVLRAINHYQGSEVVRVALKLTPMLLARPGELRHMEWAELDLESGTWLIPASKMKRRKDHIVPLPEQALGLICRLLPLTGQGRYVFPSSRSDIRPMSENAVLYALRGLGIEKGEATPHGFRATARTLMVEQLGIRTDLIEHQLAHAVRDATGEAYNRTRFLPERKEMMQVWADYLYELQQERRRDTPRVSIFSAR
jgi:integrase